MKLAKIALGLALVCLSAAPALAHFGMIIPDKNLVAKSGPKVVNAKLMFWHPMEDHGMGLAKPQAGVMLDGKKTDLSASLKPLSLAGKQAWGLSLPIRRPGDYILYMTPQPYWEPAEDCFIIHYTKTVIDALGAEEGWDQAVGTKIEIIPLTRPYGLYAGNSFTGKVIYKGKPLAGGHGGGRVLQPRGQAGCPGQRLHHPGGEHRRQRNVHLHHALGRLVGLRGPDHRRREAEERRQGQGRGGGRRALALRPPPGQVAPQA